MTIFKLVEAGVLTPGEEIFWKRRSLNETFIAVIQSDGTILTEDGKKHKTPSGAAKHLNGNRPVDGWLAWKLKRNGVPLSELRKQLN
jgi:Restriction Enzyme Adenine Methylase Associated